MSINRLPAEVLSLIFSHMRHEDLDSDAAPEYKSSIYGSRNAGPIASLVCRSWHEVAITVPSLWQHIDLRLPSKFSTFNEIHAFITSLEILHKRCRGSDGRGYLRTVHVVDYTCKRLIGALNFVVKKDESNIPDKIKVRFNSSSEFKLYIPPTKSYDIDNLSKGTYSGPSAERRSVFVSNSGFDNVEHLGIRNCKFNDEDLAKCTRLKSLSLGGSHQFRRLGFYQEVWSRLTHLSLQDWLNPQESSIDTVQFPNLKHLSLTGRSTKLLPYLQLPVLESLEIGHHTDDRGQIVSRMLDFRPSDLREILPFLKSLSLRYVDDSNTNTSIELGDELMNIESANLEEITLIGSIEVLECSTEYIDAGTFPSLKKVKLMSDQAFDATSLNYFQCDALQHAPLEELHVSKKLSGTIQEIQELSRKVSRETDDLYIIKLPPHNFMIY